jgi:hypothetical protein
LAKRIRFVLSHATGKVEVIAATREATIFKYHRAARDKDSGRVILCNPNPSARWLDDYAEFQSDDPAAKSHGHNTNRRVPEEKRACRQSKGIVRSNKIRNAR